MGSTKPGRQIAAIAREGEMVHVSRHPFNPRDQRPVAGEQANLLLLVLLGPPRPAPHRNVCAIGAHGNRINFAEVSRPRWHADRGQEVRRVQRPHPHRLVVRSSDGIGARLIHVGSSYGRRVHARIDHQHWLLIEARRRRGGRHRVWPPRHGHQN